MNQELKSIISQIRTIANEKGLESISLDMLHKNPEIPNDLLDKYFATDEILAEKILEDERNKFEEIFVQHDFDGYNDAIDILFTVVLEMASKFYHLSPSVTINMRNCTLKFIKNILRNGSISFMEKSRSICKKESAMGFTVMM